jgi:hypothetical protein
MAAITDLSELINLQSGGNNGNPENIFFQKYQEFKVLQQHHQYQVEVAHCGSMTVSLVKEMRQQWEQYQSEQLKVGYHLLHQLEVEISIR